MGQAFNGKFLSIAHFWQIGFPTMFEAMLNFSEDNLPLVSRMRAPYSDRREDRCLELQHNRYYEI